MKRVKEQAKPADPSPQQMAIAIELMKLNGYGNVVDQALSNAKRILDRIGHKESK